MNIAQPAIPGSPASRVPFSLRSSNTVPATVPVTGGSATLGKLARCSRPSRIRTVCRFVNPGVGAKPAGTTSTRLMLPAVSPVIANRPSMSVTVLRSPALRTPLLLVSTNTVQPARPFSVGSSMPLRLASLKISPETLPTSIFRGSSRSSWNGLRRRAIGERRFRGVMNRGLLRQGRHRLDTRRFIEITSLLTMGNQHIRDRRPIPLGNLGRRSADGKERTLSASTVVTQSL